MKAITYNAFGSPEVLKYQDVQDPIPAEGEVLVEVIASSVNPIDIKIRNGSLKALSGKKFPKIPGVDLAGKVIESKHSDFKAGDRIYGMNKPFSGGCNAEKIAISGDFISIKPSVLSFNTAAVMPLTGLTCIQAMLRKYQLKTSQYVLINGCTGGVGSMAVQIAMTKQAMITGICSENSKSFATSLGVDHVVNYEHEDLYQIGHFDLIFDTAGTMDIGKAKKMLKPEGCFITTAVKPATYLKSLLSKKINYVIVKPNKEDLELLTRMIEDKQILPVIENDYPLKKLAAAHEHVAKGHTRGKIIIRIKSQDKKA
jgi:NADPH:quinone reductase-like Zn-dependent oxidoreductase